MGRDLRIRLLKGLVRVVRCGLLNDEGDVVCLVLIMMMLVFVLSFIIILYWSGC
jgi:hypothetical protein